MADAVFTLAGGLLGSQHPGPGGVCVDRLGYTYVADFGDMVWKVSRHGELEEYASGFYGAAGNAIDAQGDLLQANYLAGTVVKVSRWGEISTVASGLQGPTGVTIDDQGVIYVATATDNSIARIGRRQGRPWVKSSLFDRPSGITWAQGHLYVVSANNGIVAKVVGGEASDFAHIPGDTCGGIAYGGGGLFVTSPGDNRIYRVSMDGDVQVLAGSGERGIEDGPRLEAKLSRPHGIAFMDGQLFFNDATDVPDLFGEPRVLISLRAIRLLSISDVLLRASASGRTADLVAAYRDYRSDPMHRGEDTEAEVVDLARRLSDRGERALGVDLLRASALDFPKSYRTQDAYGSALVAAGDTEEAIRVFRRSLSLNPGGHVATEALRELRRKR